MKRFEEDSKEVRLITPNINEIKTIFKDAIQRFNDFYSKRDDQILTKYVYENLYESLRELGECICLHNGYKIISHTQTIAYLFTENILSEQESYLFDEMRRVRNKSKYYGKAISHEKLKESLPGFILLQKKLKDHIITYGIVP